ncbi:uncharacterized protein CELE_F14F7.7 [Caenorhabditis elegans]|uniref:Uncharacterized protein n=1 Tax=Caenorhabditis elegans TaxID=6239 RepID=E9P894_CAEEL|nr:Uncharacterized protein CELE_F14F7.7 [Caenorhabditis elegans]CBZ01789.1 Uncharacterized protein CELE_F14F7.7 [Caenorhabditis elegans]|eukprot:NP_001255186.1 Uncharacterized protein CELE_F14F7.7 [Caenorhabditis elegans]
MVFRESEAKASAMAAGTEIRIGELHSVRNRTSFCFGIVFVKIQSTSTWEVRTSTNPQLNSNNF